MAKAKKSEKVIEKVFLESGGINTRTVISASNGGFELCVIGCVKFVSTIVVESPKKREDLTRPKTKKPHNF